MGRGRVAAAGSSADAWRLAGPLLAASLAVLLALEGGRRGNTRWLCAASLCGRLDGCGEAAAAAPAAGEAPAEAGTPAFPPLALLFARDAPLLLALAGCPRRLSSSPSSTYAASPRRCRRLLALLPAPRRAAWARFIRRWAAAAQAGARTSYTTHHAGRRQLMYGGGKL